jgi:hypothetical protein
VYPSTSPTLLNVSHPTPFYLYYSVSEQKGQELLSWGSGLKTDVTCLTSLPPLDIRLHFHSDPHLSITPPESPLRPRLGAKESSSSKKMIHGAAALALANTEEREAPKKGSGEGWEPESGN